MMTHFRLMISTTEKATSVRSADTEERVPPELSRMSESSWADYMPPRIAQIFCLSAPPKIIWRLADTGKLTSWPA